MQGAWIKCQNRPGAAFLKINTRGHAQHKKYGQNSEQFDYGIFTFVCPHKGKTYMEKSLGFNQ